MLSLRKNGPKFDQLDILLLKLLVVAYFIFKGVCFKYDSEKKSQQNYCRFITE